MQFRPITYTTKVRDITSKTGLHVNKPTNIIDPNSYLNSSLVSIYYGDSLDKNLVQKFNISFGKPGDKYYYYTNYTTW